MNTALITALDSDGHELSKARTIDEHEPIWSTICSFLRIEGVTSISVERFNGEDSCVQCYTVTPEPAEV